MDELLFGTSLGPAFPLPRSEPFTYATARASGLTRRQLRRLVAVGALRRPVSGVYVATDLADTLELRAACLRLVIPEDCVVVDRHAGWLLGAEMVLAPGEHLHTRPLSVFRPSGHGRLRNDLARSGERNFGPQDITEVHGLRVTTPLRTAWDLGRVRWPDEAITGMDQMLRLGAFTKDELVDGVERFKGMRWVTTLRAVAPLTDGRAESPPESVLRLRCHEARLVVVPQLEVWDGDRFVARLDLGNEEDRFGVEYDGKEWHSSPEQQDRDRARRDDVRDLDFLVEAVGAEELFGQHRQIERILFDLKQAVRARRRNAS